MQGKRRFNQLWIDAEVLVRPNLCSHVSTVNEFEPGIRIYLSHQAVVGVAVAFCAGIVWTLGILSFAGSL